MVEREKVFKRIWRESKKRSRIIMEQKPANIGLIGGIAKLDPSFERTSKLASQRLKREVERRETHGEFALEPALSIKGDPSRGKRF